MYGRAARTPGAGVRPAPFHERPARSAGARCRPRAPSGVHGRPMVFPRGRVAFRVGFGSVVGRGRRPLIGACGDRSRPSRRPRPVNPAPVPVRIEGRVTACLHRFGDFLSSTSWGLGSCPEVCPQGGWGLCIRAAQVAVESWTKEIHRLWTKRGSTGCAESCPPATHRPGAVVPSLPPLLHMAVHCSATRPALSPRRVKGVTRSCRVGVWETWVFLGTQLGRTALSLWAVCAELSVLHSEPRLSTASTHRTGG